VATQRFPQAQLETLGKRRGNLRLVGGQADAQGIVPIENSSGGIILATVDRLMHPRCLLKIQEELTLDVKAGALGPPRSAGAGDLLPLHALLPLRRVAEGAPSPRQARHRSQHLPSRRPRRRGDQCRRIGSRSNAGRHGLDLLQFPIEEGTLTSRSSSSSAMRRMCRHLRTTAPRSSWNCRTNWHPLRLSHAVLRCQREPEAHRVPPHPWTAQHLPVLHRDRRLACSASVSGRLDKAHAIASTIRSVGSYPSGLQFES